MSEIMLPAVFTDNEQQVIRRALRLLERCLKQSSEQFTATRTTKDWLRLQLAHQEREVFMVLYLNSQNCLLESEILFKGSINNTEVHPREVVKAVLHYNAAAVILVHNHPSGDTSPSKADQRITQVLQRALSLIDVQVLDHLIVGSRDVLSFAELGLLSGEQ